MEFLNRLWNHKVWSQVIAAIIVSVLTLIATSIQSAVQKKKFWDVFFTFWHQRIELWVCVLFYILIYVVVRNSKYVIKLFNKDHLSLSTEHAQPSQEKTTYTGLYTFFDSEVASRTDFKASEEHMWKENMPVGEIANGDFEFQNKVINIVRKNSSGRLLLKLVRYQSETHIKTEFVEKDISKGRRVIRITFQAKVINGYHYLYFIVKRFGSTSWIDKGFFSCKITNRNWRNFAGIIEVPPDKDFTIDIDDREIEKGSSSVQIRKLLVEEVLE